MRLAEHIACDHLGHDRSQLEPVPAHTGREMQPVDAVVPTEDRLHVRGAVVDPRVAIDQTRALQQRKSGDGPAGQLVGIGHGGFFSISTSESITPSSAAVVPIRVRVAPVGR